MSRLLIRMDSLEASRKLQVIPLPDQGGTVSRGSQGSEVEDLRKALAATSGDVTVLAESLAAVQREHEATIGDLTESVAKAAASSIQRVQETLSEELAAKCQFLDGAMEPR